MEMKTDQFDFELPEELIASYPSEKRGDDRLLVLDRTKEGAEHKQFADIIQYIQPGDLFVFNNTRVRKARLQATKPTGGKVEIFLLAPLSPSRWECLVRSSRPVRLGLELRLTDDISCTLVDRREDHFLAEFTAPLDDQLIEQIGSIPLPPYIMKQRGVDPAFDEERYQTVYADKIGAVAAPTAGLHFTSQILQAIEDAGAKTAFVTLEVGIGTFAPVKSETITEHTMHKETYFISDESAKLINECKQNRGRVIAVGTTVVRTLESAYQNGVVVAGNNSTQIFIFPGYTFKVIDAMVTNFHTPRSTLVMMVSAFMGRERILAAYKEAVEQRYKFFSYGDVMLLC